MATWGWVLCVGLIWSGCSEAENATVGELIPETDARSEGGGIAVGTEGGGDSSAEPAEESDAAESVEDTQGTPSGCGELCPPELCDEATGTCYGCNSSADCDLVKGEWCKNKECVQTLCVPGKKECLDSETIGQCTNDGEEWEKTLCEGDSFCVFGECKVPICEPGATQCGYLQKKVCNESGTGWNYVPCPPGFACDGTSECVPLKNNVVVVMDTSGSMASMDFSGFPLPLPVDGCASDADCSNGQVCCEDLLFGGDPSCGEPSPLCVPPGAGGGGGLLGGLDSVTCVCGQGNCEAMDYPYCESLECPISKLGLAKHTLANLMEAGEFDAANVVLHRFPQLIASSPSETCGIDVGFGGEKRGWYESGGATISGDNDAHITVAGDYFDANNHEVVSVPFPATEEEDTLAQLLSWIDGNETMEATTTPCSSSSECPGGLCKNAGGQKVCHFHGSPELRALGGTPLGRSMFYAGEYIRRNVVVDGKLCETDSDCGNVNYFCNPDSKSCFDPLASCRDTVIVLLTDGACSGPDDGSGACEYDPFFEPTTTAKRLRYGLGCAEDSDCGEGATCNNGSCQGYPTNYGGSLITYTDSGQGVERLYSYGGQPLEVTTHTVFIHQAGESGGSGMNKTIADQGGGLYFDVETDKPEGLVDAIKSVLDVKENISQCTPFLPDSVLNL